MSIPEALDLLGIVIAFGIFIAAVGLWITDK